MREHILTFGAHIAAATIGYVIASLALDRWHDRSLRSSRKIITGILRSIVAATNGKPNDDYARHQQAVRTQQRANRDRS